MQPTKIYLILQERVSFVIDATLPPVKKTCPQKKALKNQPNTSGKYDHTVENIFQSLRPFLAYWFAIFIKVYEKHDWRLQSKSARLKTLRLNDKAETEDF